MIFCTEHIPLERTAGPDRYRIIAPIGKGGMGEVYRAHDNRLGRDVALKILPAGVATDPTRLRRLEQEARAAGQINHPNVVAVYDVAEVNGGIGIVSELLEGETLGSRLARGRLPAAQAIRYAVQVAEGLAAAHRRGLIHRDLKPDNIFVTSDGDRAKILDFGLAKPVAFVSDGPTVPQLTQPGTFVGTYGYMAPEQIRGEEADQRSDIFSFGVVLFEMLSGRRAFHRASAADTISAILNEEPPEVPGEPLALAAIVRRCLAKNPDARYQSARDLAFQLEQVSLSGPVPGQAREPGRRWPWALAVTLAALLVAAAVWQLSKRRDTTPVVARTNSIAVIPFVNVSGAADAEYFSDGMTEELITALSRVQGLRVVARSSSFAFKGKEGDVRQIAKQLGVDHLLEGSVRQTGQRLRITTRLVDGSNGYQVWSETYDREILDAIVIQEEISREIAGRLVSQAPEPQRASRASADEFAAYDLYLKANFFFNQAMTSASEPLLERSVTLYEEAITRNPRLAAAYSGLANAFTHSEILGASDVEERHRKAAIAARRALELDPNLAEAHVALGEVLFHHGNDAAGAEREFRRAIELDPNLPEARTYYAYMLMQNYRLDEAIAQGRIAVRASPLDLYTAIGLGRALTFSRRYGEAIAVFERAMTLDPQSPIPLAELAVAHSMHGEHEKALAEFGRALAMRPSGPFARMVHAWMFARAGRRQEATKILNEVLAYPPEERIKACHSFGGTYIALGDHENALAWLKKGVEAGVVTWFEVKASPWFDPLRSDPRFTALIEQAAVKEKRKTG